MPEQNQKTGFIDFFMKILWVVLPIVILVYIVLNLEVDVIKKIVQTADLKLFLMGLCLSPVLIIIGALRWQIGLNHFINKNIPFGFASKYYWIGLAIGKFLPGSITWDIYRATIAGRKFGKYQLQIYTIFFEKLMALFSASLVIVLLLPIINSIISIQGLVEQFFKRISFMGIDKYDPFLWMLLILTGLFLTGAIGWGVIHKVRKNADFGLVEIINPLRKLSLIGPMIVCSMGIYMVMAGFNHLFFFSLNTPLPYSVHLFLMPILSILLLLPISFGGLGVREGVFILFYGFFDVPMETALLASLMNFVAATLNAGIGSVIMLSANYFKK